MEPRERDTAYLWDMHEAAGNIQEFISGATYARFCGDKMLRSAVERQLEIIGEASRRVSAQFQTAHPEIPWRKIIALRNILAHEYGEVKLDRIWQIMTADIPELVNHLERLIPPVD